jgi:hypothetical protein
MNDLRAELVRNIVGFFLVCAGFLAIILGAHWHMSELTTLGTATLIPAAMLALQSKHTPDGNTTTTSVTVPPPAIPPTPQPPSITLGE